MGIDSSTARHMTRLAAAILAGAGTTLPPPAGPPPEQRIRTLADLREHAARHGITLTIPAPDTAPQATLASHDTPQNHLILERCHSGIASTRSSHRAAGVGAGVAGGGATSAEPLGDVGRRLALTPLV